jgi:hypothetical protein
MVVLGYEASVPALRAGTLLLTGSVAAIGTAAQNPCLQRWEDVVRARLGVADVWFDVMLSLAAGDASGIGVSETLLEALAPARRNRVRSGKAARFYGLRRPADAAAPAA